MERTTSETSPQSDLNAHLSATHLQVVVELHPAPCESSSWAGMVFNNWSLCKIFKSTMHFHFRVCLGSKPLRTVVQDSLQTFLTVSQNAVSKLIISYQVDFK